MLGIFSLHRAGPRRDVGKRITWFQRADRGRELVEASVDVGCAYRQPKITYGLNDPFKLESARTRLAYVGRCANGNSCGRAGHRGSELLVLDLHIEYVRLDEYATPKELC